MLGAIDKSNIDVFKVFARRIVNDRRGAGGVKIEIMWRRPIGNEISRMLS